ncbi:1A family penicillin-binding protein [Burkholderia cepacia]|nr:1A family penicillin-binding protein [Burkholderia cepacia]
MMYAQYHEETYTRGFNVVTTIDSADQQVAYTALRKGIMDYERRHGYRGRKASSSCRPAPTTANRRSTMRCSNTPTTAN